MAIAAQRNAAASEGRNADLSAATRTGAVTAPMLQYRFNHKTERALFPADAAATPKLDDGTTTPSPHPYSATESTVAVHEPLAQPATPIAPTANPHATSLQ